MTRLGDLVSTSATLSATSSRTAKVTALADLLRTLDPDEIVVAVAFLTGAPRQGRIGVAWARASTLTGRSNAPALPLLALDDMLTRLESCTGPGSEARRAAIITELGDDLTGDEAAFVRALL